MRGANIGIADFRKARGAVGERRGGTTALAQPPFTLLLAIAVFGFYGAIAILWWSGSHWLHWVIENIWGVNGVYPVGHWYARLPLPFFDLEGTLSWRDCYLRGLDVMALNPCDPLGRPANYSPFWYLLPTGGAANTIALGFALDVAFLISLPLVLAPQTWRAFWVSLCACVSHATLFAVERANIDILMFLMMLGTILLWRRNHPGTALISILIAGFLKFYPLALLMLLFRERPRRFILHVTIAVLALATFVLALHHELMRIPPLLPVPEYFGSKFGALLLPLGIARSFGFPRAGEPYYCLLFILAASWAAWRLSSQITNAHPPIDWNEPGFSLLLGACSVVCGCFLLMVSINYRAIFVIAVLPGLFSMKGTYGQTKFARLASLGIWAALLCLNTEPLRLSSVALQNYIYGGDPGDVWHELPEVFCFLFRETCWWFLVIVLLSVVAAWLRRAPIMEFLSRRLTLRHAAVR